MIPYIRRDGDLAAPPNYQFPDVLVRSFLIPADINRLGAVCDKLLNVVPAAECGFEFTPIVPYVFLGVLSYPKMLDVDPMYAGQGFSTQNELFFAFMVAKWISIFPGDPLLSSFQIFGGFSMFFPYIFVDSPWSAITGREVIGYPKLIARFDPQPQMPQPAFELTASTDVLSPFDPATRLGHKPFVIIKPSAGAPPQAAAPPNVFWPWAHLAPATLQVADAGLRLLLDDLSIFTSTPTVQLKQFRDAAGDAAASYQAIVQGHFSMSNLRPSAALPQMDITIPSYDSLNIAETLGIPVNGAETVQSIEQINMQIDMTYSNVTNLLVRV